MDSVRGGAKQPFHWRSGNSGAPLGQSIAEPASGQSRSSARVGTRRAHRGWFDTPGTQIHIVTDTISGDDRER